MAIAFGIHGSSLLAGDYIITQPIHSESRLEDIIAFRSSADTTQSFVKRVLAGPGDTIAMANRQIVRKGSVVPEPYAHYDQSGIDSLTDEFAW
ncbi:MAG: S26 family signal peptidase [Gemmatimonadaceae bacterium]